MRIRIEGHHLPGRDTNGYPDVHVGVQRRDRPDEWLDPQPADAATVAWDLDCPAAAVVDGVLDVRGPYVQGGPGRRFVYLSWGSRSGTSFTMFRRAKLQLDGVDEATARAAVECGTLVARLPLTDASGGPVCASVRPPAIAWSAG